jgi:hypothetical protein
MKKTIVLFAVLAAASLANAGFPPRTTCSNEGGHITIADGQVTILTHKHPTLVAEKFAESDLNIKMETIRETREQKRGCTSRKVVFKNVTISKKDGSELPSAYNRNAVKGILDDMICSTTYSWMAAPGDSCNK